MSSYQKSKRPKRIRGYIVPGKILRNTQAYLRALGRQKREAIAYWTGIFKGTRAVVTRVIFPSEFRLDNAWSSAHVDLDTALKISESIHERHEYLLLQLHTHPFEAFHSRTDNLYPISHRVGFISVVIPYFARRPLNDLAAWKVYEYKGVGKWRGLSLREIKQRFIVTD